MPHLNVTMIMVILLIWPSYSKSLILYISLPKELFLQFKKKKSKQYYNFQTPP